MLQLVIEFVYYNRVLGDARALCYTGLAEFPHLIVHVQVLFLIGGCIIYTIKLFSVVTSHRYVSKLLHLESHMSMCTDNLRRRRRWTSKEIEEMFLEIQANGVDSPNRSIAVNDMWSGSDLHVMIVLSNMK